MGDSASSLSLYQMEYLEKIPDRAAIHEAVEIAKIRGHKGIASFVNGVLRSIQREGVPSFDAIEDPVRRLATETSHPEWLVKEWADAYGFDAAEKICRIHLIPPKQTLRVNQMKADRAELLDQMAAEGIEVEKGDLAEDAVKLLKGSIAGTHSSKTAKYPSRMRAPCSSPAPLILSLMKQCLTRVRRLAASQLISQN